MPPIWLRAILKQAKALFKAPQCLHNIICDNCSTMRWSRQIPVIGLTMTMILSIQGTSMVYAMPYKSNANCCGPQLWWLERARNGMSLICGRSDQNHETESTHVRFRYSRSSFSVQRAIGLGRSLCDSLSAGGRWVAIMKDQGALNSSLVHSRASPLRQASPVVVRHHNCWGICLCCDTAGTNFVQVRWVLRGLHNTIPKDSVHSHSLIP